jgi:hypothetical protein
MKSCALYWEKIGILNSHGGFKKVLSLCKDSKDKAKVVAD